MHRRADKLSLFTADVPDLWRKLLDMRCSNDCNVCRLVHSIPEDQGVNEPAAVDYRYMRRVWHYDNTNHVLSISVGQNNVIWRFGKE